MKAVRAWFGWSSRAGSPVVGASQLSLRRAPATLGIALVYVYRYTLGLMVRPGTCKYHPSCSQYAIDALRKHGLVVGSAKAAWRLLRCNPWSRGGVDYA